MSPYEPFGFPYCGWIMLAISYIATGFVLSKIVSKYKQ